MNEGDIIGLVAVALGGGSVFVFTAAYAFNKFVAPTLSKTSDERKHLEAQFVTLAEHLHLMEERIDRMEAVTQFDHQLREGTGPGPKT